MPLSTCERRSEGHFLFQEDLPIRVDARHTPPKKRIH
jgi:hypothetical protein